MRATHCSPAAVLHSRSGRIAEVQWRLCAAYRLVQSPFPTEFSTHHATSGTTAPRIALQPDLCARVSTISVKPREALIFMQLHDRANLAAWQHSLAQGMPAIGSAKVCLPHVQPASCTVQHIVSHTSNMASSSTSTTLASVPADMHRHSVVYDPYSASLIS
jgi:hypothetical protein